MTFFRYSLIQNILGFFEKCKIEFKTTFSFFSWFLLFFEINSILLFEIHFEEVDLIV